MKIKISKMHQIISKPKVKIEIYIEPKKAYLNNLYNLIEREEKFESKKNKISKSFEIFK
jgi:hypothetical protein